MAVAILAAMQEELAAILAGYEPAPAPEVLPLEGHRFIYHGLEVVAVRTGVGKVSAAMAAQRVIDAVAPMAIINTGVAGALETQSLRIGDVVVARDCAQHDLDATPLGFALGEVPYTGLRFFAADPALAAAALTADCSPHAVVPGRVLSGDQFIRRPPPERLNRLLELGGSVVEMEGAAIAQVAVVNQVRFAIVRTVSDFADGSAAADFARFLPLAARNSLAVCQSILDLLRREV